MSAGVEGGRPHVGSFAWLEETGGRLSGPERRAMLPAMVRAFGRFAADRARLAFGVKPNHTMSAEELWPRAPDTQLGRHAEDEASALQSKTMLGHGYRTWVFGSAFAKIDGARLDPELFYAGALVHDVGLEHTQPGMCFTHRSAEAAGAAADRAALDPHRKLEMMDGVAMHTSPNLVYEDSAIGFYLQAGAMADLAGIRAWQLPGPLWSNAVAAYPRDEIHRVVSTCWHGEAKAVPGGRSHLADAYGGFSRIVGWLPVRRGE